jgi:hypothetical protein
MIDAAELGAIANWIDRRLEEGDGDAVNEWFTARTVDELAVIHQAIRYAAAGMVTVAAGDPVEGALTSVFVIGFQLGLDAERRRRDAREMPV